MRPSMSACPATPHSAPVAAASPTYCPSGTRCRAQTDTHPYKSLHPVTSLPRAGKTRSHNQYSHCPQVSSSEDLRRHTHQGQVTATGDRKMGLESSRTKCPFCASVSHLNNGERTLAPSQKATCNHRAVYDEACLA